MEWGINLSMSKLFERIVPKGFLWRLTILNTFVIALSILLSSWAIYQTACFLVDGIGNYSISRQERFNATLFQYLLIFTGIAVFVSSLVHFYLTKKLIRPVNQLIESTKLLKKGKYSGPVKVNSQGDEISELVAHYNELMEQLQESERYRKKLVANLSHELRTPIANITGYLHALKKGDIESDQKLFESLYQQAIQLNNLIEQIDHLNEWNALSSQKYLRKKSIYIKSLIENTTQMFSWKLKQQGIHITLCVEDAEVFVHVEGIQQVLNNLIDNAIQYYKGTGAIIVKGEKLPSCYRIVVAGPGDNLDHEAQRRIFERFYRVESSRNRKTGGSGLGLAIVKEIVENHGGTVNVKSVDRMNEFSFTIPLL